MILERVILSSWVALAFSPPASLPGFLSSCLCFRFSRGSPTVSNLFHLVTVFSAIIQTFPCTTATVSWLFCSLPSSLVPSPPPCVHQQHREELVSQHFTFSSCSLDHVLTRCVPGCLCTHLQVHGVFTMLLWL